MKAHPKRLHLTRRKMSRIVDEIYTALLHCGSEEVDFRIVRETNGLRLFVQADFTSEHREDIERMVEPELNAAAFKMTDCILRGDYSGAVKILTQLYDMRTEPRMIIAVTAMIIKQLYYTKLAMNNGKTAQYIQEVLGFKSAFQGRKLMDAARSKKEEWCENALQMCLKAVYSLNTTSGADDEEILTDLVLKLAL